MALLSQHHVDKNFVLYNISKICIYKCGLFQILNSFKEAYPFSHNDKCITCNATLSQNHIFFDRIHNLFTACTFDNQNSYPFWYNSLILIACCSYQPHLDPKFCPPSFRLSYPDPLFNMIAIGLKTTWYLFTKIFYEDWADPCETRLNISAQNMSGLYVELRSIHGPM
jgi:hypothetical protein